MQSISKPYLDATLLGAPQGHWTEVVDVGVPPQEQRWLAALGVHQGARLCVLRRALMGGPLHVKTASGGAFALGGALAAQVRVVPVVARES
jgi:ferrous iron transport protein A